MGVRHSGTKAANPEHRQERTLRTSPTSLPKEPSVFQTMSARGDYAPAQMLPPTGAAWGIAAQDTPASPVLPTRPSAGPEHHTRPVYTEEPAMERVAPAQPADGLPTADGNQAEAIAGYTRYATLLDAAEAETRAMARARLARLVDDYRSTGTVGSDNAAWLAGTLAQPGFRDMLAASLSTSDDADNSLGDALQGNMAPESWDYLRTGADALVAALGHIPAPYRAEVLTVVGWTRWLDGKSADADRFCELARQAAPGRTPGGRMWLLLNRRQLPASARQLH